jgi:hypothetical protein
MRKGALDDAEALLSDSMARFGMIPDRWGVAVARGTLGNVAFGKAVVHDALGDAALGKSEYAIGMARLKESLNLFLQMNDGWGLATFMLAPVRGASDQGQWELAATLMGAAVAFSDAIGAPIRVPFRQLFEANKARARENLGEEDFARAWARGQAMTPKEAIDFAFAPPAGQHD